jgi:hypothetical protein
MSLILTDEHERVAESRVFEKGALSRIFRPKGDGLT